MSRLPWDKFCFSDFERDCSVLSNEATGIWIRLLCRTWASPRRGYLLHATGKPFTDDDAANMLRLSVERWREVKDELLRTGVASSGKGGVLYNRRQVRDEEQRSEERLRKGEVREKSRKSLSRQRKYPEDVPPLVRNLSGNFPGEIQKSEVRSQKSDTAAIAAVVPAAAQPAARLSELTPEEWAEPDPEQEAHRLVDRLMDHHPNGGNLPMAKAAAAIEAAKSGDIAAFVACAEANHAAWRVKWGQERRRRPDAFVPLLHVWFKSGDYRRPPGGVTPRPKAPEPFRPECSACGDRGYHGGDGGDVAAVRKGLDTGALKLCACEAGKRWEELLEVV